MTSGQVEAYLRRRTGVAASTAGLTWTQRLVASKWTWTALCVVVLAGVAIQALVRDVMMTRVQEDGTAVPGLNLDALWLSAGRALPTMAFWIVCFVLVDRYKPQRLLVWFLAVLWGACVAVTGAYYINNWAGAHMAVVDEMSGVSAVRLAVFVAPFVEEAMKACVIFLIAAVDRNRFTSRVSGAVIGGLVGAGFAFTENIIYYARVVVYGSYTTGTGNVSAYLDQMVFMRGVLTCFGHPLFTLMTGVGIGFAVASRSKIVRVIAPVAGYLLAAGLHMFFNWEASITPTDQLLRLMLIIAWPIVIMVALRVVLSSLAQGRTVSARLTDYVDMGWLPATYPPALAKIRTRVWTLFMSLWYANPLRTWQFQARGIELALLREAITRGTVDSGARWREYELIDEISRLSRRGGLIDGKGLRPYWPWSKRATRRRFAAPPPAEIAGKETTGSLLKYSAIDPRWGPPS